MTSRPRTPPPPRQATHAAPSPATSPLAKRPKPAAPPAASLSNPSSTMASTTSPKSQPTVSPPVDAAPPLLVKKLTPSARTPTRASAFAAGYDIYSAHDRVIPGRGKALVDTQLAIAVPAGTYGRIAPRSGLASKNFIDTGAGVIDADYRGQVKVLLFNHGEKDFEVKEGDRIAQLVLERIYTPDVVVVEQLEESVRGAGGFGSTG